jgi:hypothetical protein
MSLDVGMFGTLDLVKVASRKIGSQAPTVPVTEIDFQNLSLKNADLLEVILGIKNPTGGAVNYYLYANGDFVLANYSLQVLAASGAAVIGLAQATPLWFLLGAGQSCMMCIKMSMGPDGHILFCEYGEMQDNVFTILATARTVNPVADINRLTLRAGVANSIGVGSSAILLEGIK